MELSNVASPMLLWVIFIGLLLFGANRIPDLFRGVGEGMKEFKKATREMAEEEKPAAPARPTEPPASTEAGDQTTGAGASH